MEDPFNRAQRLRDASRHTQSKSLAQNRAERAALDDRARKGMYADPRMHKVTEQVHAAASRTVGHIHPADEAALVAKVLAQNPLPAESAPPSKEALLAAELAKLNPVRK